LGSSAIHASRGTSVASSDASGRTPAEDCKGGGWRREARKMQNERVGVGRCNVKGGVDGGGVVEDER
jgi:hypothetical protein